MKSTIALLVSAISLLNAGGAVAEVAVDLTPNPANVASYVKVSISYVDVDGSSKYYVCGGSLISSDLVITASRCVPPAWERASRRSMLFNYGTDFGSMASLHAGVSWTKLEPTVDLAILRMDRTITPQSGATAATLDTFCPEGSRVDYPFQAVFYHMGPTFYGPEKYQTTTTNILNYGRAFLGKGYAYLSPKVGKQGDFGGPVFSTDNILIGIYYGNVKDYGYSAALCRYRDKIDFVSNRLQQI